MEINRSDPIKDSIYKAAIQYWTSKTADSKRRRKINLERAQPMSTFCRFFEHMFVHSKVRDTTAD